MGRLSSLPPVPCSRLFSIRSAALPSRFSLSPPSSPTTRKRQSALGPLRKRRQHCRDTIPEARHDPSKSRPCHRSEPMNAGQFYVSASTGVDGDRAAPAPGFAAARIRSRSSAARFKFQLLPPPLASPSAACGILRGNLLWRHSCAAFSAAMRNVHIVRVVDLHQRRTQRLDDRLRRDAMLFVERRLQPRAAARFRPIARFIESVIASA